MLRRGGRLLRSGPAKALRRRRSSLGELEPFAPSHPTRSHAPAWSPSAVFESPSPCCRFPHLPRTASARCVKERSSQDENFLIRAEGQAGPGCPPRQRSGADSPRRTLAARAAGLSRSVGGPSCTSSLHGRPSSGATARTRFRLPTALSPAPALTRQQLISRFVRGRNSPRSGVKVRLFGSRGGAESEFARGRRDCSAICNSVYASICTFGNSARPSSASPLLITWSIARPRSAEMDQVHSQLLGKQKAAP